jgi:hypothetical protein
MMVALGEEIGEVGVDVFGKLPPQVDKTQKKHQQDRLVTEVVNSYSRPKMTWQE